MDKSNEAVNVDSNRRDFIKKAAYSAPAIITMAAVPSFASAGSGYVQQVTSTTSVPPRRTHRSNREHRRGFR